MIKVDNCDQLKAFLKSESKRLNISCTNTYNTFFSRLLLERISHVDPSHEFLVKGSFAQLVHLQKIVRPITDVDLTTVVPHQDAIKVLLDALTYNENDLINFNMRGKVKQTTTGIYKIPINACYQKINHPIGIDYRENYPLLFEKQEKTVPRIFTGDNEYKVFVPSIEETLAEKLYIVIKKNYLYDKNTRVKDLYDVYQLHGGEYDLDKFSLYFETFLERSKFVDADNITTDFLNKEFTKSHEEEWESSKKKYEFMDDEIDLEGSVYYTRGVLSEQLQRIKQGKNKPKTYVLK